jgi:PAS domain S-box-containing protein
MQAKKWEEKYKAFIHNSLEGIWLFELDEPIATTLPADEQIKLMFAHAYVAEANEAMAHMYGAASADELVGKHLTELMAAADPKNIECLRTFVAYGYKLSGVESRGKDPEGAEKYFRNSLTGFVEKGQLMRAWGTQQDITEQHATTTALKKSEERLALALKVSDVGIWEWDIKTDTLTWSDELKKLFGMQPDETITYEKYLKCIHPDDLEHLQEVIQGAMSTGGEYKVEHRAVLRDGSTRWILGQGKAFLEKDRPVRMIGTSISIEDEKRKDELEHINAKLKDQKAQLEALNKSKDEFISLASHQLRTPATGVKQYLGMLIEGYVGELSENQQDIVRIAYESNERELVIINDLLRVAQLDAGKVTLRKAETDLTALVKDVVDEQLDKFKARQQKVTVNCPSARVKAMIDSPRIRMVFENLIDNASKYTPEGKPITIKIQEANTAVVVSVIDKGIGISEKDMPRLFQKFSRLQDPLISSVDGTGLGLYWADKIVKLHHGTLTVTSQAQKGSTFTVTLPKETKTQA